MTLLSALDPWDFIWGGAGFVLGVIFSAPVMAWIHKRKK
jgi:SNF family Na+-dependent transporter